MDHRTYCTFYLLKSLSIIYIVQGRIPESLLIGKGLSEGKDGGLASVEQGVGELVAAHLRPNLHDHVRLEDHLQRVRIDLLLLGKRLEVVQVQWRAETLEMVLLIHSHVHVLGTQSER